MNIESKRIAFCLYGQIRYVHGLKQFYEYICDQDEYKVDIFIATWSDFDTSLLDLDFTERLFFDYNEITKNWAEGNTQKMSFLLTQALGLKRSQEIKQDFRYDFVIPIRPDIVFKKTEFFNTLRILDFENTDRPSVLILNDYSEVDGIKHVSADYMFIESSDAADIHSCIYNFFYQTRRFIKTDIPYREGGHWIHVFLFYYYNFNVIYNPISSYMVRPERDIEIIKELAGTEELIPKLADNKQKWKDVGPELLSDGKITIKLKGRVI